MMNRTPRILLVCAVASLAEPVTARAQNAPPGRVTVEVRAGHDGLSNGRASWDELALELRHRALARSAFGVSLHNQRRFGQTDRRLAADGSTGIGTRLTIGAELEGSSTHRVVARSGGAVRAHVSLGAGWGVEGRASLRHYDAVTVRGLAASLERYWSRYLAAYAAAPVRLSGSGATAMAHSARITRFLGERGSVTLGGSTGSEVESVGSGAVLAMDVRSVGAWGTLPVVSRFDLTFALAMIEQDTLFTRSHVALGLRAHMR